MSLFMRAVSGSNGVNTMAILPQFYHDLRNVTLRFKTLPSTYSIKVGIMPDVNDASSFELVQTINLRQSNDNLVSFAYYEGAPGAIAFRLEESGINITEVWVDTLVTCQAASQISYDQITPYGARSEERRVGKEC